MNTDFIAGRPRIFGLANPDISILMLRNMTPNSAPRAASCVSFAR
jgi:hypothetical protein